MLPANQLTHAGRNYAGYVGRKDITGLRQHWLLQTTIMTRQQDVLTGPTTAGQLGGGNNFLIRQKACSTE